jgi:hypothetical protein
VKVPTTYTASTRASTSPYLKLCNDAYQTIPRAHLSFQTQDLSSSVFQQEGKPVQHALTVLPRHTFLNSAFFDDQNELLSNVISSVGDGQIVIETTVKEADDFYHNLVKSARDKTNEWTLAFFPWHKEDKYKSQPRFGQGAVPKASEEELKVRKDLGINLSQLYWRHQQIKSMGYEKFHREFPSTIDEAFYTKSQNWLSREALTNLLSVHMGRGPHYEYEEPLEGEKYAMGVDVSGGTGGDYSTITVVSSTTKSACLSLSQQHYSTV